MNDFDAQYDRLLKIAEANIFNRDLSVSAEELLNNAFDTFYAFNKDFDFKSVKDLIFDLALIESEIAESEKCFANRSKLDKRVKERYNRMIYVSPPLKKVRKRRVKKSHARPIHELWREANRRYIEKQKEILSDVYIKSLLKPERRTPYYIKKKRSQLLKIRKMAA